MTREEAIEYLKRADTTVGKKIKTTTAEAIEMAIQSLTAISELSKSLKAVNCYEMDEKVLIGFNMAVAIFNKCFGESCALENEQTADVKPIVYGEWKYYKMGDFQCTNCGFIKYDATEFNFCPSCGAYMRKESEEEE